MLRVVVDSNLWISYLIGRRLVVLKELFRRGDVLILTSDEQLAELNEVTSRFKFRKYFSQEIAEEAISVLYASSEFVVIDEHVSACRDEDDGFLLELGVNGHADMIVTGDSDLLVLNPFRGIEIVTYRDFEERLKK